LKNNPSKNIYPFSAICDKKITRLSFITMYIGSNIPPRNKQNKSKRNSSKRNKIYQNETKSVNFTFYRYPFFTVLFHRHSTFNELKCRVNVEKKNSGFDLFCFVSFRFRFSFYRYPSFSHLFFILLYCRLLYIRILMPILDRHCYN
jgi:hypothetical protein